MEGCTTTNSRTAGIVKLRHHLRQYIGYCISPTGICKWRHNLICRKHIVYRKMQGEKFRMAQSDTATCKQAHYNGFCLGRIGGLGPGGGQYTLRVQRENLDSWRQQTLHAWPQEQTWTITPTILHPNDLETGCFRDEAEAGVRDM